MEKKLIRCRRPQWLTCESELGAYVGQDLERLECLPRSPPNEMRLSCGAKLECSQTEFYNTGCCGVSATAEDGRRRQLQARVRRQSRRI